MPDTEKETLDIGEISELVTQMLKDDEPRDRLYAKIDMAAACQFEPDAAIKQLPWVQNRHYAMTDIADAKNAGVRTFSTLLPDIQISPNTELDEEYERVEMAEQAVGWEFERMNRVENGKKGVHDQIVESAVKYHAVAFQTEYLKYKMKGKSDGRTKAILARKCFNWPVHHPGTIHSRHSEYGLEAVAKVNTYSIQTLIENFGRDNPGVAKILEKHKDMKPFERLNTFYTLVDYTDWTHRVQFVAPNPSKTVQRMIPTNADMVMMNERHGLPFIPWVISDYGDPLWQSVIESGMWENLQYLNLIRFAKAIELSTRSNIVIQTPDGRLTNVWIDFTNPSNPIVIPADGTMVKELSPTPLDPGIENQFGEMRGGVSKSTVSSLLQDVSQFKDSPFATMNSAINLAVGQLSPAKKTAEAATSAGIYQDFQWIDYSGIPMTAYRRKNSDSKKENGDYRRMGEQIGIFPGAAPSQAEIEKMSDTEARSLAKRVYFDLSALYVKVTLQASNIADEQARLNVLLNAKDKAGMSSKEIWERMGWQGYVMNQSQRAEETLSEAELQSEAQNIMIRKSMEEREKIKQEVMQEMQAQQQQQAQAQAQQQAAMQQQRGQQAQTNQMNAGSQMQMMQGVDMRQGGGMSSAQVAPNETREMVTGQSASGEGIL